MQEHHEVSPAPPAPTPSHHHHAGGGGGGDCDGGGGGDGSHFFEGTEKLLEIWFSGDSESGDLRQIPRHRLDELMKTIHCLIMSESHTDQHDAYILSESSLFVSSRRVILKTCGSTLLLRALGPLLQLAESHAGLTHIEEIFYSRKNFLKPSSQQFPHRSFQEEAAFLEHILPGGASYCMGPMNKDCWYLYTLDRSLPASPHLRAPDQTLEVLMSELDPAVMSLFFQRKGITAQHVTQMSGIADLIPGSIIDEVLFDPCGYSMNGLTDNGVYWTIHVTPESGFSYVSFETNVALDSYDDLVAHVTRVFQPGRFITTLFFNETSPCRVSAASSPAVAGFELLTRQLAQFTNHYSLSFCSFTRNTTTTTTATAATTVEAATVAAPTVAAAPAATTAPAAATAATSWRWQQL
uniref:adenosylmethionine decarboxylase n=1 Tax=Petromyzon marinus TaxID=7757 RepID=A0AAJ7UEA7_PETMA|nr:S-adenosylmethionine decarboxylase proenzyme [Petromyzon marinus]